MVIDRMIETRYEPSMVEYEILLAGYVHMSYFISPPWPWRQ